MQGMDPSALLCMLYCCSVQTDLYARKDKCKEKIFETAQESKITDWMVQEHCYFPYSTTIASSVLQEFQSSDTHHCLDYLCGLTLPVTELCTHKNNFYFEFVSLHHSLAILTHHLLIDERKYNSSSAF